tara:strand:- start:9 stop:626 length:618 start_codon:yes stop_codon:yes gene_type:complete
MKKTPFYPWHLAHGAGMTTFHDWRIPLWYKSTLEEHRTVRSAAGLFDVSHIGHLAIRGLHAPATVDFLTTNCASHLTTNQGQYSLLCNPSGGILDDLVVYRIGFEEFLFCVNAMNRRKDYLWIQEQFNGKAEVADISSSEIQLALQDPHAEEICNDSHRKIWLNFLTIPALGVRLQELTPLPPARVTQEKTASSCTYPRNTRNNF